MIARLYYCPQLLPGPRRGHVSRDVRVVEGLRLPAFGANALLFRRALTLGLTMLVATPLVALAQVAPSQVTPQTLRPPSTIAPTEAPQLGALSEMAAPPGAAGLSVKVKRVIFEGAFPEFDRETRAFAAAVEGKRVSVAGIYEEANKLEQAYARAGYVLVRVVLPPQKLNDGGPLRIVVVDGFIEKVQVDNAPERMRALIADRMAWLVGRRHVRLDEIERRLLIAGDAPGLRLKSTLARGATPGGATLVLEGEQRPASATLSVDNRLPASLGTWAFGANMALNSPFGLGEQFYASALLGGSLAQMFDFNAPLRVLGGGLIVPLGVDGWILNPEYTNSRSRPNVAGGLAEVGDFQRLAVRTSYPLIRTRSQALSLSGAFEYNLQSIALPKFATDLNKDRYSVLRVGGSYESGLPWWDETLQSSAIFSQGVGGRDAAEAAASGVPLSRQGAGPTFSKANVDLHLIQPLPESFRIDLFARAQASFGQAMLVSEQFALDGPGAVSSYPLGSINVDQGALARGELSRPFAVQIDNAPSLVLTPYLFGAYGAGRLVDPTVLETATVWAAALGAGLRSDVAMPNGVQSASFSVEAARQYSDLPNLAHAWRGNVSVSLQF